MTISRRFVCILAGMAMLSVGIGLCCRPIVPEREMSGGHSMPHHDSQPAGHESGHESHSTTGDCCSAHEVQIQPVPVELSPPLIALLHFDSHILRFPQGMARIPATTSGWPPGHDDIASMFSTLLI